MNMWIEQLRKVVISILGVEYSSSERLVIAFLGIIAFFVILKLFTGVNARGNATDLRRVLGSIIIFATLLGGAVVADIYVVPYVTNYTLKNILYFSVPLLSLGIIGVPLLMVIFKNGYGSSLIASLSALAGFAAIVFVAGFLISSMQGTSKEFVHLKGRTRSIDNFINH